jgi:hypothetical protein
VLPEELPEVKEHPIFRGITLLTEGPEKEVAELAQALEDALQSRLWQLADETIAAILKKQSDSPIRPCWRLSRRLIRSNWPNTLRLRWLSWSAGYCRRRGW